MHPHPKSALAAALASCGLAFSLASAAAATPLARASLANAPVANAPVASAAREARIDEIDKLLADGRALLDRGDAQAALKTFEKAAAADKDSLRTRMWVLRAWLALDRINDALDQIDELAKQHKDAPELAYLYGMAFYRLAEQKIASGKTDAQLGMNFQDATANLKQACASKRAEFNDAWLPLSKAAWNSQDNPTALMAAEEAVKVLPQRADAWRQLGSAALANHIASAEKDPAAAAKHVERAIEACRKAIELAPEPATPAATRALADSEIALADAQLWKRDTKAAGDAYARALALEPTSIDIGGLWQRLGNDGFLAMIVAANEGFAKRHGADDARDATMAWWAGNASFTLGKHDDAEKWFTLALKKAPGTLSSWYYLARSRTARGDGMGAAEALRKHWETKRDDLLAWLAYKDFADANRAMLAWVSGNCFKRAETMRTEGKLRESLPCIDSALAVSEIRAAWTPDDPEAWSNVGLFVRDQGDVTNVLRNRDKSLPDPKPLWERAYEAYAKSLALDDKNADTLNDTAVILHYNLRRDFKKARELYEKALARAQEQLKDTQLDAATREHLEKELVVWVNDNLKKLDGDEKAAVEAASKPAEGKPTGAPPAGETPAKQPE